jgi:hypothetical protein
LGYGQLEEDFSDCAASTKVLVFSAIYGPGNMTLKEVQKHGFTAANLMASRII